MYRAIHGNAVANKYIPTQYNHFSIPGKFITFCFIVIGSFNLFSCTSCHPIHFFCFHFGPECWVFFFEIHLFNFFSSLLISLCSVISGFQCVSFWQVFVLFSLTLISSQYICLQSLHVQISFFFFNCISFDHTYFRQFVTLCSLISRFHFFLYVRKFFIS